MDNFAESSFSWEILRLGVENFEKHWEKSWEQSSPRLRERRFLFSCFFVDIWKRARENISRIHAQTFIFRSNQCHEGNFPWNYSNPSSTNSGLPFHTLPLCRNLRSFSLLLFPYIQHHGMLVCSRKNTRSPTMSAGKRAIFFAPVFSYLAKRQQKREIREDSASLQHFAPFMHSLCARKICFFISGIWSILDREKVNEKLQTK